MTMSVQDPILASGVVSTSTLPPGGKAYPYLWLGASGHLIQRILDREYLPQSFCLLLGLPESKGGTAPKM
jgi:hypothetical protein